MVVVATTLSADRSAATLKRVQQLSDDLSQRVQQSADSADWRGAEFETAIEALVEELVPAMAGDVAAIALRVAFSGDESAIRDLEARAERMEKTIEAGVEKRATALERRAEKLCPKLVALDRLESELRFAWPTTPGSICSGRQVVEKKARVPAGYRRTRVRERTWCESPRRRLPRDVYRGSVS